MDHWLDNCFNAVIAESCTQLLVPLPFELLIFSRCLRVCESLEKHSGCSGWINAAHSVQQWLPFAQMPHHHDWHHEGHKGSNYTFAALGGLWDTLFGTRHYGRAEGSAAVARTAFDASQIRRKKTKNPLTKFFDHPLICPLPLIGFFAAVVMNL